jgi:hypothetical protein
MRSRPHFSAPQGLATLHRAGVFMAWTLLLTLPGCGSTDPELQLKPGEIVLRSSFPGYTYDDVSTFDPSWPEDITLRFNRVVATSELNLQYFPAPESMSGVTASTTSGIVRVEDFVPLVSTVAQHILIDGPEVREPYLLSFYSIDPPAPSGIFSLEPASVAVAGNDLGGTDGSRFYGTLSELPHGDLYTIAAILDTSGDGSYDPLLDWWGVSTDPNAISEWFPEWSEPGDRFMNQLFLEVELQAPR